MARHLLFPFLLLLAATLLASGEGKALSETEKEYLDCNTEVLLKCIGGQIPICECFEEVTEKCVNVAKDKVAPGELRKRKVEALHVTMETLEIEGKFDPSKDKCAIFNKYKVKAKQKIEGNCDVKEYKATYQRFFDCKARSDGQLQSKIQELGEARTLEKVHKYFCDHLEHVLDVCFEEIERCSTSRREWKQARQTFIDTAGKATQQINISLDVNQCKLKA